MANSVCASYRPTIVALSLLQTDMELTYTCNIPSNDMEVLQLLSSILQLQQMCMVIKNRSKTRGFFPVIFTLLSDFACRILLLLQENHSHTGGVRRPSQNMPRSEA